MVQIDVALSAAGGATLASAARVQLRSEDRIWRNGYLGAAVAFSGFFLVPSLLYFLGSWPAWDTMYLFDQATLPGWFLAGSAGAFLAASGLGFVSVHATILKGRATLAAILPAIYLLPAGAVLLAFPPEVLHVGSRASFAAGAPVNLIGSGVFWALVLVMPFTLMLPLAILVWRWAQPAIAELKTARAVKRAASS